MATNADMCWTARFLKAVLLAGIWAELGAVKDGRAFCKFVEPGKGLGQGIARQRLVTAVTALATLQRRRHLHVAVGAYEAAPRKPALPLQTDQRPGSEPKPHDRATHAHVRLEMLVQQRLVRDRAAGAALEPVLNGGALVRHAVRGRHWVPHHVLRRGPGSCEQGMKHTTRTGGSCSKPSRTHNNARVSSTA